MSGVKKVFRVFVVVWSCCIFAVAGFTQSESECAGRPLNVEATEGLKAGSVLFKFKEDEKIVYSFHQDLYSASALEIFQISPQGLVTNVVTLDREDKRGSQFTLTVLAKNNNLYKSSEAGWINPCSLTITILDLNDNAPRFKKDLYVGSIRENLAKGAVVQGLQGIFATDLDTDANSVHSYEIVPGGNGAEKFDAVTEEIGGVKFLKIISKVALNREESSFYVLTVRALDAGKAAESGAHTQIRINIEDANDCTPTFDSSEYLISMLASTPVSTSILKIHAHDDDAEENAEIYYYFKKFQTTSQNDHSFTLDPHTGEMRVARRLDITSRTFLQMTVVAQDRGFPPRYAETVVKIEVYKGHEISNFLTDATETPRFARRSYVARIREDLPLNSHILHPDVSNLARSKYQPKFSVSSHEAIPFQVDVNSGFLYLEKKLDFETTRKYEFQLVIVSDSSQRSLANVTVLVDDADENFHAPMFEKANIATTFDRNWKLSRFVEEVKAIDSDHGLNGKLHYYVDDGNAVGKFTITEMTGRVFSVSGLNWDASVRQLELVLEARDSGSRWKSAKQFLLINVVGQADCSPQFERTLYTATVREALSRGNFVFVTKAIECQGKKIVYSITDGNSRNSFKIDKDFGIVSTVVRLDREEQGEYTLEITASHGSRSSQALLVINIDDVNDHDPKFLRNDYQVEIAENRGETKSLLCVVARDDDAGKNAEVSYNIASGNRTLFHIDASTGILSSQSLNFEDSREHILRIKGTDHGDPARSSYTTVRVLVKNVNDPPKFGSSEVTVNIVEEKPADRRVVFLAVVDEDHGRNGEFDCSYENIEAAEFGKFRVVTRRDGCEILTNVLVKWFEGSLYSLRVRVTDRASPVVRKTDVITVNIKIKDVNNHDPVFSQDSYWSSVSPGTSSILRVTATDEDSGRNARIRYSLATKSAIFKIHVNSGQLTAVRGKLRVGKHKVEVYAEDQGRAKRRSKVTCHISVNSDVTRKPVKISFSPRKPRIAENAPVGRLVTSVRVNKAGSKYSIVGGNTGGAFSISQNGRIRLDKALDYETVAEYKLVIRVAYRSRGGLELAKEKHLNMRVVDINDNYPRFRVLTKPLVININTRVRARSVLTQILADDADSANTITYRLKSSSSPIPFDINPHSGKIDAQTLVQSRSWPYSFTVIAEDGGTPRKHSELEVQVRIYGDHASLKIPPDQLIGKVDEGPLGKGKDIMRFGVMNRGELDLTYSILRGNIDDTFCVDVTGSLHPIRSLDRESHANYRLSVSVDDGEISDVNITVSDVNDNRPQFLSEPNMHEIHEIKISTDENEHAQKIKTVRARDWDSGMNGNVTYRIVTTSRQSYSHVFAMDHGILMITRTLDREETARHVLTIEARDQGTPSLRSFVRVILQVQDKNDNPPLFLSRRYAQRVPLSAPKGYSILQTFATDQDNGANGKIRYSMQPLSKMFAIDESTGWINVASELSRGRFLFNVTATDGGTPRLSGTASVEITVEVNAGPPRFLYAGFPRGFHASVRENEESGTRVLRLTAVSKDLVTYGMYESSTSDLVIHPFSGEISTTRPLDYEDIKYYEFTVSATDRSERISLAHVNVSVINMNDNKPRILNKDNNNEISCRIRRDVTPGSLLMKVEARDDDNDELSFALTQNSKPAFFTIDVAGRITTARSLQGIRDTIYLAVTVRDNGDPVLEDTVTLNVISVNYGRNLVPMRAQVSEDTGIGKTISVSPKITPRYKSPRYSIIYPLESPFTIHRTHGYLSLKTKLDYEKRTKYSLTVRLEETGDNNDYVDVDITIEVKDENDNRPELVSFGESNGCKNRPEFKIHENAQRGSLVYAFEARDRDSGLNGAVFYRIERCLHCTDLFSLDMNTGELKTTGVSLSRPQYEVNVAVYDKGIPEKRSLACITVVASKWRAEFTKEEYHFVVKESATAGHQVGVVEARGFGVAVTYELSTQSFYVNLNPITGVLTLKKTLDYESSSERKLELAVDTKGQASTAKVIVHVEDVNDCAPVFDKFTYTDRVPETAPVGSTVLKLHASDGDSGLNAEIRYSLESMEFLVDAYTGVVSTAALLDYEKKHVYSILVTAHDRGSPSQNATAQLVINIGNVNDRPPVFTSQEYSCSVWENAEAGSELAAVEAADEDGDKVRYDITAGNNAGNFAIDQGNGVLKLTKKNSLVQPFYILNISATDGIYWGYSRIRVKIKDVNDHAPIFLKCQDYHPSIPENSPLGTTVLQVSASDEDLGVNGEVEYAIAQQPRAEFRIVRTTGRIETRTRFDREKRRKFSILVKATDGSSEMKPEERLEGSCSIEITITDVNDNKPVFERKSYAQRINENVESGHRIMKVSASDADEGVNGKITYSLKKPSSLFAIQASTGVLKTQASIINKKNKYTFKIIATDHGLSPLSSEVDVTIDVIKSNNKLQFKQSFYEVSIPENFTKFGIVARMTVTPRDPVDEIMYSIDRGNTPRVFAIDDNGVVSLSGQHSLDRETTPVYTLTVCVTGGDQIDCAYTTLRVVITDVNDCAPEFERTRYDGTVPENAAVRTTVLRVSATDKDLNSNTVFSMAKVNKHFNIDSNTGLIQTRQKFDREKKSFYRFQVVARDKERPNLSSVAKVLVRITDVNDLPPVFQKRHYECSVKENEVNGTVVATVTATDGDRGVNAKIIYTIKSGDIDGNFRLDPDDGRLSVKGNIDYEVRTSYELILEAWDGKHEATTRMDITVEDENDNNPTFGSKRHEVYVSENSPSGTLVTRLEATDVDSLLITYSLSEQMSNVFVIGKESGEIKTKMTLDREMRDTYKFEVYAKDEWRTGSVTVIVHVLDVNDHTPTFTKNSLKLEVLENQPPGTVVGTIRATDLDDITSGNGRVYYGIMKDTSHAFSVDRDTGELRTSVALDRENRSRYELTVNATDAGTPPRSTYDDVIVIVGDANDQQPQFSEKVYEETIAENTTVGSTILQLKALDGDLGMNANLSFSLLKFMEEFQLEAHSGRIRLAAEVDYERKTKYEFDVKVEDGGKPKLSHRAKVIIHVTDSNDCSPTFSSFGNFDLHEGRYTYHKLGRVVATDADGTEINRELRYSIPEDADESGRGFVVNPFTGDLFVNTTLDFEAGTERVFTVTATNVAYPHGSASTEVRVELIDVNDNPPGLVDSSRDQEILENSNVKGHVTLIGRLRAFDRDTGANGEPFTFGILPGNEKNLFQLDAVTGWLSTVANFDREEKALYLLDVWVRDSGSPALTNNITVRVHVIDRNDNQHKEGYLELSVNIFDQQTISPNNPIGQVFVNDSDTDDLRYYDVITGDTSTFTINRNTGNITINKRPASKEYKFRVKVSDRNSSFHPVECRVKIKVKVIPYEALHKSITLRFLDTSAADVVTNLVTYRKKIAKALKTIAENVDIFTIQPAGTQQRDVDVRLAAHGSPFYAPERLIAILKRSIRRAFPALTVGYNPCVLEESCKTGGCHSGLELNGDVRAVDNNRGTVFSSVVTTLGFTCASCEKLFPVETSCLKRPCLNSGVCTDVPGAYLCACPERYDGPNCELTTRSFKPGDWVWLRALKSCRVGSLSLEFSTVREDGLLLYAGPTSNIGPGDTFDFIAVQLRQGRVRVKLSLGDQKPSFVTIRKSRKLSDGEWHLVEIYRNETYVRVIIDQCNSALVKMSSAGQIEDRSNCEQTLVIANTKYHSLNINNPVQIGGMLGSPPDDFDIRPLNYEGCIRNVKENGIIVDLKDVSYSSGSQEGCPVMDKHCPSPSPCSQNASCLSTRTNFTCVCPPGFEGRLCSIDSVEQSFNESSFIKYRLLTSFLKTFNAKRTQVEMMIRTRDKDGGPLVTIRDKQGIQRLMLRLTNKDGAVSLEGELNLGQKKLIVRLDNTLLDDGKWHHVTLTRYRNEVNLGIDLSVNPRKAKAGDLGSFIHFELTGESEIILGSAGSLEGFDGCMKDVRLNGETLPHNTSNLVAIVTKYGVTRGCHSKACDGKPCPRVKICHDEWRKYDCLSRPCLEPENACLNGAECVDDIVNGSAKRKCRCSSEFYGPRCENGSRIIRLSAEEEVINVKLVIGLSCFALVLVLTTLIIVGHHRYHVNGKATFDKGLALPKLDMSKDSSKKSLFVVDWMEPGREPSKTNNSIKNLPTSRHCITAHVHNTTRPPSVSVTKHPLEPEVTEHKPLSQLPAWDIPPMIDIVLSPDSDSSIHDDYIEDPDDMWEDAETTKIPDDKSMVSERLQCKVEPEYDESKVPAVSWNDIEEYGRKFYKMTRNFLGRDDGARPSSGVSSVSNSSSVITVVENPLA